MTLRTLLLAGLVAARPAAADAAPSRNAPIASPAAPEAAGDEDDDGWAEPLARTDCRAQDCAARAAQEAGDLSGAATLFDGLSQTPSAVDPARRAAYAAQAAQDWLDGGQPQQARLSAQAGLALTGLAPAGLAPAGLAPTGLALAPLDDLLHLRRAQADNVTGHADEAMADLDRVLAHQPGLVEARVARAVSYRRRGMIAEASADIDAALAARPDDAEALLERGILDQRAGRPDRARAAWQHVLAVAPDGRVADHAREDLALLDAGPAGP